MPPKVTMDINWWFTQAVTDGTPIYAALHRKNTPSADALAAALSLLKNSNINNSLSAQSAVPTNILSTLLLRHIEQRLQLDIDTVVMVVYGTLFAKQPYEGETWLLSLQEAHWTATPVPQREQLQTTWMNAKLRHANQQLSLFLRIAAGSAQSDTFTGMKRIHAAIRREIHAAGADGRRQRSATFWNLQLMFVGGEAALKSMSARLPTSDASLLQTVLIPRLMTPAAGLSAAQLPAAIADLQKLLDVIFTTTPSKNSLIRQVKMTVRNNFDASVVGHPVALLLLTE